MYNTVIVYLCINETNTADSSANKSLENGFKTVLEELIAFYVLKESKTKSYH
jgi:hypothetical protein